jgi:hypothetical protein
MEADALSQKVEQVVRDPTAGQRDRPCSRCGKSGCLIEQNIGGIAGLKERRNIWGTIEPRSSLR